MTSSTANYAITPKAGAVLVATANTNRDGTTGTYTTVFTAGSSGSLIERILISAIQTTTAGMLRLWRHNGTACFLEKEIPVSAVTVGASTPGFAAEYVPGRPIKLPSGWALKASTHNAESFHVNCDAADFA